LGLVRYGRNNLVYAAGMGSYLQLLGYLTDAPLPVDGSWEPQVARLLDECSRCHACERHCPGGAVARERVLLRVERCLTAANEAAGSWPSWVTEAMHHALIGCLTCQRVCPVNPPLPVVDTGVTFGADDTAALLSECGHPDAAWDAIRARLAHLGQPFLEDVLGRNLRALVRARGSLAERAAPGPTASGASVEHPRNHAPSRG
jgi:epoxyqueuosine reductase